MHYLDETQDEGPRHRRAAMMYIHKLYILHGH